MDKQEFVAAHFPNVPSGRNTIGPRVTVQLMTVKKTTASGIIIAKETRDFNVANAMIGRVVDIGPLAYRNRNTMDPWPEGVWVQVGDVVEVPQYGGFRFSIDDKASGETATFGTFQDHEIIHKIDGLQDWAVLDQVI